MKVAIYIPPIPDENTTPPLGPLYLLAVLEQHGFEGWLFDARIDRYAFRKLIAFQPDIVGISAVTSGYLRGLRVANRIKEIFPECPIIFGGPHPSSLPEDVIAEPLIDYVLIGESEKTFLHLCQRLKEHRINPDSLQEVKNLVFMTQDETVLTERTGFLSSEELEQLPWPAFHRMNLNAYFANTQAHGLFRRGKRILPLMSTRGCPYPCTFCCRVMGNQIRSRSIEAIMEEIRFLVKQYGIDELYFEDDNFTVQRDRALEILDRLAAFTPPIYVKFANGIRADKIDRELLQAMKQARVYSLSFGIESGYPATLKKMKKTLALDKARENVLLAKSLGFLVGANCIIGYPGETPEDIKTSLDFFFSLPLDSMAIVNLVPFPGTEVRKICEKNGYLTEEAQDWDNYFFSINNPYPLIETPELSKENLVKLIHKAYWKMYSRPRWLWRTLRHLSPRQILSGAAILLGLRSQQTHQDLLEIENRS